MTPENEAMDMKLEELEELVAKYEAAAKYPATDQRHIGTSVATQLVHAQRQRELAEASLAFERVAVAELRMSEHKAREELSQLRREVAEFVGELLGCGVIGMAPTASPAILRAIKEWGGQ